MAVPESKCKVGVATRNVSGKKAVEEIVLSTGRFQLQEAKANGAPDLIFYEIGKDTEREFEVIEMLLESRTTIIPTTICHQGTILPVTSI